MTTHFDSAKGAAVALSHIDKRYGSFFALRGIEVEFERGKIHALVGQNGAGKSTCLGLISGRITPTAGTLSVLGKRYEHGLTARTSTAAGVATVYQELSIFTEMSAIDNVFIGQLGSAFRLVNMKSKLPRYLELSEQLGVEIPPHARVSSLSLAQQQMLEIMRGLALNSRVLLLDEPTAVLAPEERQALFDTMRDLRDQGVTIIFVSHYLDEVLGVSDTITVFRNGELIEKSPVTSWKERTLVNAMLGDEADELARAEQLRSADHANAAVVAEPSAPLLSVHNLSVGGLQGVNLTVNQGEIVGIGGLVGSGRSTLLRALAGAQPAHAGSIEFDGVQSRPPRSPRQAWKWGIGYIPEERKVAGLALGSSSLDNIIVGDLAKVSRFGWISSSAASRTVSHLANRFGISPRLLRLSVGNLSGGNQQKVLFARWGLRAPKLLLADESTRGVDIGAKGQIMQMLREMASTGMGVVFVSSDLEEVAAVSDRIYVFSHGKISGHLTAAERPSQDDILRLAFGIGQDA